MWRVSIRRDDEPTVLNLDPHALAGWERDMLERLVKTEDDRVLAGIELDTPEWDAYFGT